MRTKPNRVWAWAVLAAAMLAAGAGFAEPVALTIVHFNDLDRMEERRGQGGVARLAAVVRAERARGSHVLVTFAGDAISPSLLSGIDKGAHMIDLLNRVGLTAMAIGNHEYDFGPAVARQRFSEAEFPVLGANNVDTDGEVIDGARASIMVDAGRFKVGIFGLTTVSTAVNSSPGDVTFRPVPETAAAQAAKLRASGAHLVIALAHTNAAEDDALLKQRAVDVLLSGDDHRLALEYDGAVLFAESGQQADWVTVIDLTLDEEEPRGKTRFVWSPAFRAVHTGRVSPDPELAAAVRAYRGKLSQDLDVEVGETATGIDSRRATVRTREAAVGNLIADAMRAAVGADMALVNSGGIRGDKVYPAGARLTRRDILVELPFGDKTVLLEVTGRQVRAALENGFSRIEDKSGRFPQVSGIEVVFDPARPAGSRVVEVRHDGAALDPDAAYRLATNDFLGRGGDGYGALANGKPLIDANAGRLTATQVMEYIAARGSVAPRPQGRLRTVD